MDLVCSRLGHSEVGLLKVWIGCLRPSPLMTMRVVVKVISLTVGKSEIFQGVLILDLLMIVMVLVEVS
jgi:hypothetical protein